MLIDLYQNALLCLILLPIPPRVGRPLDFIENLKKKHEILTSGILLDQTNIVTTSIIKYIEYTIFQYH